MIRTKISYKKAVSALKKFKNIEKIKVYQWFFKTGPGEYGEGDKFLGLSSFQIESISKDFNDLPLIEVLKLLKGIFHEERMLAVRILVNKFEKANAQDRIKIAKFYLKNSRFINNWDLVDVSAHKIVGPHVEAVGDTVLFDMARSKILWDRRIAIISTFHFIKKGSSDLTLKIAELLLGDKEDLMHKAVGWMLREVGKRCGVAIEEEFLMKYYKKMPRTMLRYAIEKFEEKKRKSYLLGKI
jgi:3-methyladenine DNA glycosylase AlkD